MSPGGPQAREPWACPECGERINGQLDSCPFGGCSGVRPDCVGDVTDGQEKLYREALEAAERYERKEGDASCDRESMAGPATTLMSDHAPVSEDAGAGLGSGIDEAVEAAARAMDAQRRRHSGERTETYYKRLARAAVEAALPSLLRDEQNNTEAWIRRAHELEARVSGAHRAGRERIVKALREVGPTLGNVFEQAAFQKAIEIIESLTPEGGPE